MRLAPEVTGVSIVWRYIRSDVGTTCNGDDKYRSTRSPEHAAGMRMTGSDKVPTLRCPDGVGGA